LWQQLRLHAARELDDLLAELEALARRARTHRLLLQLEQRIRRELRGRRECAIERLAGRGIVADRERAGDIEARGHELERRIAMGGDLQLLDAPQRLDLLRDV